MEYNEIMANTHSLFYIGIVMFVFLSSYALWIYLDDRKDQRELHNSALKRKNSIGNS